MKSRVSIFLALLVFFSAGLAGPLHAAERTLTDTFQLVASSKGDDSSGNTGSGPLAGTLGDPDGWLGGQNARPLPPISDEEPLLKDGLTVDTSDGSAPVWGKFLTRLKSMFRIFR